MKRALWALCLVVIATSCGGSHVGASCEKRSDCGSGQECVLEAPGGYCTRGCIVEGGTQDCPGGTICTFFGGSTLVCSTPCTVDEDCRINFECMPVLGSGGKLACRPGGIVR